MARYLHRCSDGKPCYYVDVEGGDDPMIYGLDNVWVGYIANDGVSVYGPDRQFLYHISEGYFCDSNGVAQLYFGEAEEEEVSDLEEPEFQPQPHDRR
jgi:hypothetical protein